MICKRGKDQNIQSRFKFFIQCLPVLRSIVTNEIKKLGLDAYPSKNGGVISTGGLLELYKLNLWLRTANRILVRLLSFYTDNFNDLIDKIIKYPWEIYINKTNKIIIKTDCKKSRLYHSDAVSQRVAYAIEKRIGHKIVLIKPKERDNLTQTIFVRISKNKCTISIDSSGAHLHERGYHVKKVKAPLRETIAAAMIYLSQWDCKEVLWDPFCGSGTILIEAALIALNIAPGIKRNFAFMNWKNFDQKLFNSIERKKHPLNNKIKILGTDISLEAINCSIYNAEKAGIKNMITFSQKDFFKIKPLRTPGFIITNPPYGKRLNIYAPKFYNQIKRYLETYFPLWKISILCPQKFTKLFYPSFKYKLTINNGGIWVNLLSRNSK